MLRSAGSSAFRSALRRSPNLSPSTRLAQTTLALLSRAALRTTLASRSIHTTTLVKMPHMPQGIVKGGKEELKLANQSLWQTKAYVNGAWVDADDKSTLKVFNKATGAELGQVPDLGAKETAAAIAAAEQAFKSWSQTTAKHRHDLLVKLFYAHQENADDLAKIIVAENGKAFAEAKGEIAYSNGFLEWFAEEATRTYGHTVPSPLPGVRNVVQLQPVGVAGLITPWNFPAAMITRKAAPALAAGCTVVIKAPSETPFSALAFAHLAEKVGFPKGTINVVTCAKGDNEIAVGKELCENPIVRKISFTGSTRVGKILMSQSASTLKKLSMELGGNAPFIVFEDADLDKAVEGAIACKFRGSGQTCICANRIYVHAGVKDEFLKKLAAKVNDFKLGYGMDDGVTHGPLVSEVGLKKVEEHVTESVNKGAKVVVGGKRGEGLFYEPTVITDLPEDVPTDREETFGPLAAVYTFTSEQDVVRKANNVDVGLAGYFFSKDTARCWRVAEQLQVGMVGVNTGLISQNAVPFGGVHESGFGREGGRTGIEEYMFQKLMVFGGVN